MPNDGRGQQVGFVLRQFERITVSQQDTVTHDLQMHRVGTQPVGLSRHAPVCRQADWRKRPVLLAGDTERPAQGGFHALRRAGLAFAACQQRLQRRQAQVARGDIQKTRGRKQMRDEQQHESSVTKRIFLQPIPGKTYRA